MVKKTWSDDDPTETKEWLDALASLVKYEGKERAEFILKALLESAQQFGLESAITQIVTPYCNTIASDRQPNYPGDLELEAIIDAIIRWNAIAMVMRAKLEAGGVGGHLS